jgi:hypothetical protein
VPHLRKIRAIGQECAPLAPRAPTSYQRGPVPFCEVEDPLTLQEHEAGGDHHDGLAAIATGGLKCGVEVLRTTSFQGLELNTQRASGELILPIFRVRMFGIPENADLRDARSRFLEKGKEFAGQRIEDECDTRQIACGTRETCHKPALHGIVAHPHHDVDGLCRLLDSWSDVAAECDNEVRLETHQFRRQFRQPLGLASANRYSRSRLRPSR